MTVLVLIICDKHYDMYSKTDYAAVFYSVCNMCEANYVIFKVPLFDRHNVLLGTCNFYKGLDLCNIITL